MHDQLRAHFLASEAFSPEDLAEIGACFLPFNFKKGETIFLAGDRVPYAFYLVSGLVKLVYTDEEGNEHIVSFAMGDWWESDFGAYLNGARATLSLHCLEDTVAYGLPVADYQNLCAKMPAMTRFFLRKTNGGFVAAQRRILSLITKNAAKRYEQLLQLYPSLPQRVSKGQLAAYLGVSRETLSRILSCGAGQDRPSGHYQIVIKVTVCRLRLPIPWRSKRPQSMKKTIINPWEWQDERQYVQAVEVTNVTGTFYISGQTAINAEGVSSTAGMGEQLDLAIQNLETVIAQANYDCANIVRLTIYTTSHEDFMPHFPTLLGWVAGKGIKTAVTFLEVVSLFETLTIELEATVVR